MPKVSRPVVYTALAAVAAYALFLNTQPDSSSAKRVTRPAYSAQTADPNALLPEDLNAHFPRYGGGGRDPFAPQVALARPKAVLAHTAAARSGAPTGWALTGINSVNGVASALIENSATGDSVFLQPGDRWNGLRVVAIKSDSVLFENALGHPDILTFATPAAAGSNTEARSPASGSLPPYPVAPLQAMPIAGSPFTLPQLPPLSGASPSTPEDDSPPPDSQDENP